MNLDIFEDLNLGSYLLKLIGVNIAVLIIAILFKNTLHINGDLVLFFMELVNVLITSYEFRKGNISRRQVFVRPEGKTYFIESPFALILIYIATSGSLLVLGFLVSNLSPQIYEVFLRHTVDSSNYISSSISIKVLNFISIAIIAPLFEEVLFRGVLFNKFRNKFGITKAIVFSSLLFFSLHFTFNPSPFLLGITNCLLVVKYRSLIPGIIIHMINNTFVLSVQMFSGSGSNASKASVGIDSLVIGLIMFSIYAIYIYNIFPSTEKKKSTIEVN